MTFTPFTAHFDRTVEESLRRWHVPGVAFSVLHKESSWSKGYGLADVKSKSPVDPSTTFFFFGASTTKKTTLLASACILTLHLSRQFHSHWLRKSMREHIATSLTTPSLPNSCAKATILTTHNLTAPLILCAGQCKTTLCLELLALHTSMPKIGSLQNSTWHSSGEPRP